MKQKILEKIINKMERAATTWRFIKINQMDEEKVKAAISDEVYKKHIDRLIKEKDYSAHGYFTAYKRLADLIFSEVLTEDFLDEVYQYTLAKSFRDAVIDYPEGNPVIYELFLIGFRVMSCFQKEADDGSFMSIYPLKLLDEREIRALDDQEYSLFKEAFDHQYIYEMMKLNYEITGHSTIEHILGVHYLAMKIARQVKEAGIPVDLGRVSAAAAGHDIGKFGCRPEESSKIAYYHYYYTYHWFSELEIKYIKNVAVYHSTWDLELESLSIESLILIYSDFCVKRSKSKPGLFKMKFLSVDEAFEIILSKLDNVDDKKKKRYERVYNKLKNFYDYLESLGVDCFVENYMGKPLAIAEGKRELEQKHYPTLESGDQIVKGLKHVAIEKSILLMHRLRHVESLNEIIQDALSEKNIQMLRRYLFVFEEYSTYLTPNQKLITMDFLYNYLIHSEEDIRKECSRLIGKLIAFYDENYTKELPERAEVKYTIETKYNKLRRTINQFLFEDTRLTPVKRGRQIMSYYELLDSLFVYVDKEFKELATAFLIETLLKDLDEYGHKFMLESLAVISPYLNAMQLQVVLQYIVSCLEKNDEVALFAVSKFDVLLENHYDSTMKFLKKNRVKLSERINALGVLFESEALDILWIVKSDTLNVSDLYLSNLKSAVSKTTKEMQIDYLYHYCLNANHDEVFYTAMHFCNILKVSAYEAVRQRAGKYLVKLYEKLNFAEKNDIVIELIRALEIEGYGFTRYIPNFLGQLIPKLNEKEYNEIINDLDFKLSNAGMHVRVLILSTLSHIIQTQMADEYKGDIKSLIGIVFKGFFSGDHLTEQIAFNVLCKDLIGNETFSLEKRFEIFKIIYKKLNVYIMDIDQFSGLNLLNYSVGLHYIYRFITDFFFFKGEMKFEQRKKIGFYPGTFDPFSLGQKAAAMDAASMDMDVFIAISEFHWRRRTQASLMRRKIVEMSIADQMNIFTFPQTLPINLKNAVDLKTLDQSFHNQEIYIIIGEETLLYNNLYKETDADIYRYPHIIYKRESINQTKDNKQIIEERINHIQGDVVIRTLEYKYEMIDVEQIRRNIDNNWDAYDVIDDLATKFIIESNLYKNEPQFKSVVTTNNLKIEVEQLSAYKGLDELCEKFNIDFKHVNHLAQGTYAGDLEKELILKRNILTVIDEQTDEVIALSIYCKASPKHLFSEINSLEILDEIACKQYEKILIIDYVVMKPNKKIHALDQIILTETLVNEIRHGYQYAVIKCMNKREISQDMLGVIIRSGFVERHCTYSKRVIFSVDMSKPVVINLDGTTRMKADFRQDETIRETIKLVRSNLQQAVIQLYPGNLVLSFDRSMLYNHLIRLITDRNGVGFEIEEKTGPYICVPYGDIFKRWLLPNTITKAFHTERYYSSELASYEVDSYPGYLSIENQASVLKSFDRPVMLIDDILDKGKRFNALDKYLSDAEIEINQVILGILTERGKLLYQNRDFELAAAYYIPSIRVWFNEADLYPYIGGDSLKREGRNSHTILLSANLMLPFSYPKYIKDVRKEAIYNLSVVCLENAITIMNAIEKKYLSLYRRSLSISGLREVMITPRVPDIGAYVYYDKNQKPSVFLHNELERLKKMSHALKDTN